MPQLTAPRAFNRRQSLALAAWAILGAGCYVSPSVPKAGAARSGEAPGGAPEGGPPKLGEGLSDPIARQFYRQRGGKPAWTAAQAKALTDSFGEARRHGLNPAAFAPKDAPGDDPNQQDVALTLAALRYARALAFGFVDPKTIEKVFTLERNQVDLASGLQQALDNGDLPGWLASLPPADAEYQALSAAYQVAAGPMHVSSVPDRVARCQSPPDHSPPEQSAPTQTAPGQNAPDQGAPAQGPPAPSAPAPSAPAPSAPDQTAPAPGAVAPGPSDHGQAAGEGAQPPPAQAAPTGAALSRSSRARQLAANLERRRWLSRAPAATRVDVNTASCTLVYLRPGADSWAARLVCGKVGHETPSIQGSFHRLIANPPWRVPRDIARKEIFPKGGGYLRRENMRVVNGQVVQQPGARNSLGLVKFDVQDPYAIYLHDTPSKSLFALRERHKSHGCVRVQNAVGFARLVAGQAGKTDAFNKALASGKTREVDIGEAIPVRLLYHTAFADEGGKITFVADVYGWNEKLATALGFGPPRSEVGAQEPDVDIGP